MARVPTRQWAARMQDTRGGPPLPDVFLAPVPQQVPAVVTAAMQLAAAAAAVEPAVTLVVEAVTVEG